jgi:hypothetical protein
MSQSVHSVRAGARVSRNKCSGLQALPPTFWFIECAGRPGFFEPGDRPVISTLPASVSCRRRIFRAPIRSAESDAVKAATQQETLERPCAIVRDVTARSGPTASGGVVENTNRFGYSPVAPTVSGSGRISLNSSVTGKLWSGFFAVKRGLNDVHCRPSQSSAVPIRQLCLLI